MMKLRMGFSGKLYFIIAMSCAGLLAISALQVWQLRSGLMDQKHTELTHLVESALSIMQAENTASTRGEIPLDEAKSRASQRIAQLRYGNGDYFWINDLDAKMIMHPIKPELNGKDVSTIKDPNGKQLFVEFVNVAVGRAGDAQYPGVRCQRLQGVAVVGCNQLVQVAIDQHQRPFELPDQLIRAHRVTQQPAGHPTVVLGRQRSHAAVR